MNYSVLMAVYAGDNPDFLKQSINSMINQTKKTNDFVIIKDGILTHELEKVLKYYEKKYDGIFNIIQINENVGLGKALNFGILKCKNELIARMDADDISLPNRCELQILEFKRNNNLDVIGSSVDEFSNDPGKVQSRRVVPSKHNEILKFAKYRDPFNHPSVMYKKSSVVKVGNYREFRKNQDTDLWIRMLHAGCQSKNIENSLLLFRFDEKTLNKRTNWQNTKLLIKIRFDAFKIGFNTLFEFLIVSLVQLVQYIMPGFIQEAVYKKFLRSEVEL